MSAYLLSSGISKVAEEFIVRNHVGPAVLAPVVQTLDNAIHRTNHHPLDIAIGFAITYPVDSDPSGG